ncbi:glycosyltransferase [Bifidobacterium longum subsp. longum]|nr:glycosyltransferase [Bifidobacterium longum subsp. longum]
MTTGPSVNDADSANGDVTVSADLTGRDTPTIYFVLPCYNEAEGLEHTAEVLLAKYRVLASSGEISEASRILFVDDGSKDATWSIIRKLHVNSPVFSGVKLSHNRGHQNALLAGLMTALHQGCDAAISMDADLQDDVNAVDEFIRNFKNGDEIVYGVRSARKKDTWFKRNTAEAFYKVFEWMGGRNSSRSCRLSLDEPRGACCTI